MFARDAGEGLTTAVTTAPVGVAGTCQPSARNAATSAACFASLISKKPCALSSLVDTPGSTSSSAGTICTCDWKCTLIHSHTESELKYTSTSRILDGCALVSTLPLIVTSGATGVAWPGVSA